MRYHYRLCVEILLPGSLSSGTSIVAVTALYDVTLNTGTGWAAWQQY